MRWGEKHSLCCIEYYAICGKSNREFSTKLNQIISIARSHGLRKMVFLIRTSKIHDLKSKHLSYKQLWFTVYYFMDSGVCYLLSMWWKLCYWQMIYYWWSLFVQTSPIFYLNTSLTTGEFSSISSLCIFNLSKYQLIIPISSK